MQKVCYRVHLPSACKAHDLTETRPVDGPMHVYGIINWEHLIYLNRKEQEEVLDWQRVSSIGKRVQKQWELLKKVSTNKLKLQEKQCDVPNKHHTQTCMYMRTCRPIRYKSRTLHSFEQND